MSTALQSGACSPAGMSASSYGSIAGFKRATPLMSSWQILIRCCLSAVSGT
jgi:hypothetical protein